MTLARQGLWRTFGILMVLALLLSTFGSLTPGGAATGFPGDDGVNLNASLVVKAKNKSYRVENGIHGIDVSKYQGSIDWSKVANDGVEFAFVRSNYGTTLDPYFVTNATKAHENGVKVGAYHFATFTDRASMRKEAESFISQLKKVNLTYPAVLDLEAHRNLSRSSLTTLAVEFLELVKAQGYKVMLYTGDNFLRDRLSAGSLSEYDLWIANYLERPSSATHKIWQYSSTGTVSGISGRVDLNVAFTDMSVNKKIAVDKTVSDSIKQALNERYSAGIPLDGLNMDVMNAAIAEGFQHEINRQWEADLIVDGEIDRTALSYLNSITFTSETQGNITYLLQAKLFYKGYYVGQLTGAFDANTVEAVTGFQKAKGLSTTGTMNDDTWTALLQ